MKISNNSYDVQPNNGNFQNGDNQKEDSNDSEISLQSDAINLMTAKGLMPCTLCLTPTVLSYEYKNKLKQTKKIICVKDIINCSIDDINKTNPNVILNLIIYRIRKNERKKKILTFGINKHLTWDENYEEGMIWKKSILSLNYGESYNKSKPLLFIVNPKSGRGRALKIFRGFVEPLLVESETYYELQITQYANHAMELMRDMEDITRYLGVVVVSGDGLLYEVVNGLTQRKDTLTSGKVPIALGIIPGGSGNGLAHAVNQAFLCGQKSVDPIFDCTLHVTQGKPMPMDLIKVTTIAKSYYSFLSVGWGLMADIDIESECLRMLGEPRFTVWALYRSFALRKYHAKLSYCPEGVSSTIPDLSSPIPSDWVTIEDDFIQIYCSYQTHISSSLIFAPKATFDDGLIWLLYLRGNVSRKQVIQFLLALEKGNHINLPYLTFLSVRAFRIEPTHNVGRLTVDGELVDCGPAQAEVIPRMANILTR